MQYHKYLDKEITYRIRCYRICP